MAIVVGASSTAFNTVPATSLTLSHTVASGDARILVVNVATKGGDLASGVTYGGVTLTKVMSVASGTVVGTSLWRLVNPVVGTADLVATLTASNVIAIGATSYTGVHQTTPLGTAVGGSANSATASVVVSSAANELVVDGVASLNDASIAVGAGQTLRYRAGATGASFSPVSTSSTEPGAASVTMSWSLPGAQPFWAIVAVPIKPAPEGVFIGGSATGTSATSGTVVQGRPIAGSVTGISLTSGWLARYPAEAEIVRFRGGPKRLARSMWRATVDNVRVEDITAKVTGASVSMDIDRTIPSTLSVDLIDPSVVRPYSDYLAPTVTITEIVSGAAVTSQVGLYRAGLPSMTRHPNAVIGTVGGGDIVSLLVNSGTGAAPYNLAPGANYMAAAVSQCNLAGVTRVRFPVDARTVPTGKFHSWPPGTARCRIVLDIMLILGYLPPWSDHEGYLVTRVVEDPGTQAPARSYVDGDGSDLTGEVQSDPATTTLANHLVVTYDNITAGTVLTAERTNDDPTSPASIPNIGERFRHEAMTQAADQAAVDAYASQLVEQWGNVLMHLSLTTPLDPVRGYWESADVAIHAARDDAGIVGRFRVKGWDHDLSAGTTAVSLRRNEGFSKAVV